MVIKTKSKRLAFAAMVCRLFPPAVSGRLWHRLYPEDLAQKENASFITKSSLSDVIFKFPKADLHATHFAIRGFFEWRNVVVTNVLCGVGDTIIDIGSNVGTETLLYAKIVGPIGRVFSFEPFPAHYLILQELIKINQLNNIELYQAAVADKEGKLRFLPPPLDYYSGVGRLVEKVSQGNLIEVDTVILDRMFASGRLSEPKLIIMDTEGSELFVLQGAEKLLKQTHPFIILEVSPSALKQHELSSADIFDFMKEHNYECWSISGRGLKVASRSQTNENNWLCIPAMDHKQATKIAKRVSRKLKLAAMMPLIKGINPAVIKSA